MNTKKMRFFYLDSNRAAHKRLQNLFQDIAEFHELLSIAEAEATLTELPEVDCFFVEYNLGTKNGLHFIKKIRLLPGYDHVPVFLLTSMVNEITAWKAMRCGVSDIISKLYSSALFCQIVAKHLDCPHTKFVRRPYYEIQCASWQREDKFYQFSPDTGKIVCGASPEEAFEKMKSLLSDLIGNGKAVSFDYLEIETELHRIIPVAKEKKI